jgi:hypothetical protein
VAEEAAEGVVVEMEAESDEGDNTSAGCVATKDDNMAVMVSYCLSIFSFVLSIFSFALSIFLLS